MNVYRHLVIFLIMFAMAVWPMAKITWAQDFTSTNGKQQITASEPKVMGSADEPIAGAEKGTGHYLLWSVLGVAVLSLAAAGAGGGSDGGGGDGDGDSGIEVKW